MPSASLEALSLTPSVGRYVGAVDCGVRRKARASASCWFFPRPFRFLKCAACGLSAGFATAQGTGKPKPQGAGLASPEGRLVIGFENVV